MNSMLVAYSFKVAADDLEKAKRYFARQGLVPQETFRALVRMAADCERCLTLHEAGAPTSQVQSAFAAVLADSQHAWKLNGRFQDAIMKIAQVYNIPQEFILNVLHEAQGIQPPAMGENK